ncbi:E3 ubiquitin-protein ligase TRIM7-like [Anolis sagrei]|uniref:E3 ubiquitin-protein ligase TRIM7-like n=1 Tax=Anolis sagrei TaxID=38937 RepID=UPI00352160CF
MLSESFTAIALQRNAKESESNCYLCKSDMAATPRAQNPFQDLREEATCSVCLDYFRNPVTLDCGHNFCRDCLTQFWENPGNPETSCPQCREIVSQKNLRTNQQLANFVEITKKYSTQGSKKAKGKERVCEKHQEPLKLFCKDDETLICERCDKEHTDHRTIPLGTAAQDYKLLMGVRQDELVKVREKILEYKAESEKEAQDLFKQTKTKMETTLQEIREMQQFLAKQEKQLQAQMEELEKQIARKRDERFILLSRELSSLESLIQETKEKCQQPPAELLQDVRNLLQRCEARKEFKKPDVFPLELKWKILDYGDIALLLEVIMKQVRDELKSGFTLQKATVTLDPDTAHGHLILSEDHKSITLGDKSQNLPDNLKRFDKSTSVLGCDEFTSGRHFWEICVGEEDQWLVGVARKSMERKGDFVYGPEGGIWAIGKWGGAYRVANSAHCLTLSLKSELKRIRVSLNYTGGQVAFYDADTGVHLYSFSEASFIGETLLPFFNVYKKGHLRIPP